MKGEENIIYRILLLSNDIISSIAYKKQIKLQYISSLVLPFTHLHTHDKSKTYKHMNPRIDDSGEIGVFDAARYFSGYEMHGTISTQSILKVLDPLKNESYLVLQKANQKKISKGIIRLSMFFNSLFHKSKSKRNKHKQLESSVVPGTAKSYPKHCSECIDGSAGELWRDRRLDGIMVVGKRWVLNNSTNDEGQFCKDLLGEKGLYENKEKNEEDDDSLSDASSDLFELENCN